MTPNYREHAAEKVTPRAGKHRHDYTKDDMLEAMRLVVEAGLRIRSIIWPERVSEPANQNFKIEAVARIRRMV